MSTSSPISTTGIAPEPRSLLDATRDPGRHRMRERKRAVARTIRRGLLGFTVAGALVATVFALRPRPVPVDAAHATRGPLVVAIEESGVTRVKDRYVVSASVTGSVSRSLLEPGDEVKQGDILAEIAPAVSPLLDQRARAEAEARLGAALSALAQTGAQASRADAAEKLALQELARVERLANAGSIARQVLEQAEFEARIRGEEHASAVFAGKVAAEEVRMARASLGRDDAAKSPAGEGGAKSRAGDHHVDVLAPASGRVLRVQQKSAGVVQAGSSLVEVGDPAVLEAVVDLLTTDAVHVAPGTPVGIRGWGGEQTLGGRIRKVEPSAFTRPSALGVDEQRVNVIVSLTDPPEAWSALGDGYRIQARIILWQGQDVLKVPQGAVFRHGDAWAAFRIDEGVTHLVPVGIGHRGETDVEIVSGLAANDVVAVHPGDRVKDGVRVEIAESR
jgi:HlyD family secretion protein